MGHGKVSTGHYSTRFSHESVSLTIQILSDTPTYYSLFLLGALWYFFLLDIVSSLIYPNSIHNTWLGTATTLQVRATKQKYTKCSVIVTKVLAERVSA